MNMQGGLKRKTFIITVFFAILLVGAGLVFVAVQAVTDSKPSTKQTDSQYVELPTVGIRYKKSNENGIRFIESSNILYTVFAHNNELDELYEKCGLESRMATDGSFAALVKKEGTFDSAAEPGRELIGQYEGYYVTVEYPKGISQCARIDFQEKIDASVKKQKDALKNILKTAEELTR
jgi:hypothetical protein